MCWHYGVTSPVPMSQVVPWVETGAHVALGSVTPAPAPGSGDTNTRTIQQQADKYFARTAMDVSF